MTTRLEMLDRVRKALGRQESGSGVPALPTLDFTGVMPPLEPEGYQAKFEAEWDKVSGIAYRVATVDELEAVLVKILSQTDTVTLSRNPLLAELHLHDRLTAMKKAAAPWGSGPGAILSDFKKASFAAGVGITGVDFVLVESGTMVLSSATEGAQLASLAPPVHVALYRRNQLVGSLEEVLAKLPISTSPDSASPGRSVVFVTGTSRTADIEQILIRGVHGPRENHAILVEDSCR